MLMQGFVGRFFGRGGGYVLVGNRRWPPEDKESGTPASSDSEQRSSHLFLILASTTATCFTPVTHSSVLLLSRARGRRMV